MKYIKDFKEGDRIGGIYLCKHRQAAVTRNGKPYENVILQDKTGTIDAKIWDPYSQGINDFDILDYIDIMGDVSTFGGSLQISIKRLRKAGEGEYEAADYLPVSENSKSAMYQELLDVIASVKNIYLNRLLRHFFIEDQDFIKKFCDSSAAKSVHHGFMGGLLEHTLHVADFCDHYCKFYPFLDRDLLITGALFHDMGKTRELSPFPQNDYTDDGQLLGHLVMGAEMIHDGVREIPGFPNDLESQLKHCVLAHHGELEYGSPKKPATAEALALNLADNADAKLETMKEIFQNSNDHDTWIGYNRLMETNIRRTSVKE